MITGSYDLDTIEEAFDVALKLDLTFKTLVNPKAQCSKCKGYGYYDYQCPSECQQVRTVSSNDVDDSKVVEDVHVPPKTATMKTFQLLLTRQLLMRSMCLLMVPVMTWVR